MRFDVLHCKKSRRLGKNLALLFLAGSGGCKQRSSAVKQTLQPSAEIESASGKPTGIWLEHYQERMKNYNSYIENNDGGTENSGEGFRWMRDFPLGFAGPPLMIFQVLPTILPEIVGKKEDLFRLAGFGHKIPTQWSKHDRSLPLGLGFTHTDLSLPATQPDGSKSPFRPPVAISVITCGGCHIGRVKLRGSESQVGNGYAGFTEQSSNGGYIYIPGAPNVAFDSNRFRNTIERVATHPMFNDDQIAATAKIFYKEIQKLTPREIFGDADGSFSIIQEQALKIDSLFEKKVVYKNEEQVKLILMAFRNKVKARIAINQDYEKRISASEGWVSLNGAEEGKFNGTPGQLDAFGLANSVLAPTAAQTEAALEQFRSAHFPKSTAVSDIMSVWDQDQRAYGNWNGNMKDKFYRNLGASLGGVADPNAIDTQNARIVTTFLEKLPAAPYPFHVNTQLAFGRGKDLFEQNCSDCHGKRIETGPASKWKWQLSALQLNPKTNAPKWINVSTDMSRATVQNETMVDLMRGALKAGCVKGHIRLGLGGGKAVCEKDPDTGIKKEDPDIVTPTHLSNKGYIPLNLGGIWARAPYLHNGSVPTLRHLLLPPEKRPTEFIRGAQYYDSKNVGFVWDRVQIEKEFGPLESLSQEFTNLSIYKTTFANFSNQGHYNLKVNNLSQVVSSGVEPVITTEGNWPKSEEDINALLEYLKTF